MAAAPDRGDPGHRRGDHKLNAMTVLALGTAAIAPAFDWSVPLAERPILPFASGLFAASLCFVVLGLRRTGPASRAALVLAFAAGLVARFLLLPSTPILEDDFYRYLWDGAVVAQGLNPYAHAPLGLAVPPEVADALAAQGLRAAPPPADYQLLLAEGRGVLGRINHPHVTTIYPPLVQAAFGLAYGLAPWSLLGWKLVVLLAELATLGLLLGALRTLGQPLDRAALYWLNPLVLTVFANSAHMDALLLPALAGAAWLTAAGRTRASAYALAIGAAVKLWPLLLIPAALPRFRSITTGLLAGLLALLLLLPQLVAAGNSAGLGAYAGDWQRNALAFPLIQSLAGLVSDAPERLARLLVAGAIGAAALWYWQRGRDQPEARLDAFAALTGALLLLSPTGYPWYATWLLPFAVLRPRPWSLLLVGCAPAHYLAFHLQAVGRPDLEAWLPPLLGFGPAWAALLWSRGRTSWPIRG
jgi:hypothetical protein